MGKVPEENYILITATVWISLNTKNIGATPVSSRAAKWYTRRKRTTAALKKKVSVETSHAIILLVMVAAGRGSLFILGRNGWLNMTGRKWESEAGDASRYCQITRRMRQISLFRHLVLVISLASFSSLISLVWRYVVVVVGGGSHQPCTYNDKEQSQNSNVLLFNMNGNFSPQKH